MGATDLNAEKAPTTSHDLSHHLSSEALARTPNVMKDMARLMQSRPSIVSLANGTCGSAPRRSCLILPQLGDPHYSLYPIRGINFEVASITERDPVAVWRSGSAPHEDFRSIAIPDPDSLTLVDSLAYGPGVGTEPVLEALKKLIDVLHSPSNHVLTLTLGNADGVAKAFRLLGNPGDSFLADELTFTGVTAAAVPQGVKWIPVRIDDGGMLPDDLENILKTWDVEKRGKRPHVLYAIP